MDARPRRQERLVHGSRCHETSTSPPSATGTWLPGCRGQLMPSPFPPDSAGRTAQYQHLIYTDIKQLELERRPAARCGCAICGAGLSLHFETASAVPLLPHSPALPPLRLATLFNAPCQQASASEHESTRTQSPTEMASACPGSLASPSAPRGELTGIGRLKTKCQRVEASQQRRRLPCTWWAITDRHGPAAATI